MAKHRDRGRIGRSHKVPYLENEHYRQRHARRKKVALKDVQAVAKEAHRSGISLKVTNDGHHWTFIYKDKIAEWWPSSAKLVLGKNWRWGVHAHDADQVLRHLRKKWRLSR